MSERESLCDAHDFQYREIDGQTWNVCWDCGFRELWAGGMLVSTSDAEESDRLDSHYEPLVNE